MTPEQRALLEEQRRILDRIPRSAVAELVEVALRLIRRLNRGLAQLGGRDHETRRTNTIAAKARALIQALGERYGDEVAAVVARVHGVGAEDGRRIVNMQLDGLDASGLLPQHAVPANADNAGALLDRSLLELHEASRRAYGREAIQTMKRELAAGAGALSNETIAETQKRIEAAVLITPARAERIVRTEHSYALHHRQLEDFKAVMGDEIGEWRKQLVATLDSRTGADSIFVNGQTRKINEKFQDNLGNDYDMPPNRPNDREVVVYVPA